MRKKVIVAAGCTTISALGGTTSNVPTTTLSATVIKIVLRNSWLKATDVDTVVMGNVLTTSFGQNPSRQTAIKVGLSNSTPIITTNKIGSFIECFDNVINTLKKYEPEVVKYFNGRNTIGFVEGFNNKVKILRHRYHDISNIKRFFSRLYLDIPEYHILLGNSEC